MVDSVINEIVIGLATKINNIYEKISISFKKEKNMKKNILYTRMHNSKVLISLVFL